MGFAVKMHLGTDIRRRRFEDVSEVTFDALADMVRENFGLASFIATYRDDEGDMCSLSALTLPDALNLSGGTLKLQITEVIPSGASSAARATAGVAPSLDLSGRSLPDHVASFNIATPVPGGSPCKSISGAHGAWQWVGDGPQQQAGGGNSASGRSTGGKSGSRSSSSSSRRSGNASGSGRGSGAEAGSPRSTPCSSAGGSWVLDGSEARGTTAQIAQQAELQRTSSDESIGAACSHKDAMPADEDPERDGPEAFPMPAPSAPPQEQGREERGEEGGLADSEKIVIVLAAFDADGDGRLSFREANELQHAAWGGRVSRRTFARVCADVGADARRGLGPAELAQLYVRLGTLERDFTLSVERLQGGSQKRGGGTTSSAAPCRGPGCLLPLLALPVAMTCPLVGVPLVVLAASHCRQRRA